MLNEAPFIDFIMKEAEKKGKLFILDSGEGNDCIDAETGWYIEDLSGWYINADDKERLLKARENGTAYYDFSEAYVFAKWSNPKCGVLEIAFNKY